MPLTRAWASAANTVSSACAVNFFYSGKPTSVSFINTSNVGDISLASCLDDRAFDVNSTAMDSLDSQLRESEVEIFS